MDQEATQGAKTGVLLIIVAAVIVLVLGIFLLGRGIANNGMTGITTSIEQAGQSEFADYDQMVIVGNKVTAALKSFEGKNYAVLVSTQALKNVTYEGTGSGATNPWSVGRTAQAAAQSFLQLIETETLVQTDSNGKASGKWAGVMPNMHWAAAGQARDSSSSGDDWATATSIATRTSKRRDVDLIFRNYNAVLATADNKTLLCDIGPGASVTEQETNGGANGHIYFEDGYYVAPANFLTDSGRVVFDNNTLAVGKSGMIEYISQASRFNANLLKDATGNNMGIVCEQISK